MLMSTNTTDWATVVEKHRHWIERVIVARTGAEGPVEDVIQEVNLAVTRSNSRPTCPDQIAPWLCKIVVRQCALVVRNQMRHQHKLSRFQRTRETPHLQSGDPVFWLLHEECREIVREELARMNLASRQLLVWKYLQDMSYHELASRLNVSIHAAEYRVIEARKELRRRLEARGVERGESP
jgi:RNA polymerase sigma factor (sigma-70 family)